jgi:hypothetical protein
MGSRLQLLQTLLQLLDSPSLLAVFQVLRTSIDSDDHREIGRKSTRNQAQSNQQKFQRLPKNALIYDIDNHHTINEYMRR